MKKIVLIMILTLSPLMEANSQTVDEVTIGVTFEIGRNSTNNCSRFGLCTEKEIKVTIKVKVKEISSANRLVQDILIRENLSEKQFNSLIYKGSDGLFCYFDKANYDVIYKYINSNTFVVEEDFNYNNEVNNDNYIIKKGNYTITFDNEKGLYLIIF